MKEISSILRHCNIYIYIYIYIYIDGLIDFRWVRALTVPMHLALIDGPFVPHNLISAQESPVSLPKFQMAPRPKIFMSSGSKKGTQIHYPFLLRKSRQANLFQFPHRGPYEERYPLNPLNQELNPICYLLALLAYHFLHVSRIRVKSLTLRLLMSYIYIWSAYS